MTTPAEERVFALFARAADRPFWTRLSPSSPDAGVISCALEHRRSSGRECLILTGSPVLINSTELHDDLVGLAPNQMVRPHDHEAWQEYQTRLNHPVVTDKVPLGEAHRTPSQYVP